MKKKKVVKIIIAASIFGVLLYGIYAGRFFGGEKIDLTYTTEKVTKGNIQAGLSVDGKIIFDTWNLAFLTSGIVDKMNVALGDEVTKGQVLATIDASGENSRIAQFTADLNASIANKERLDKDGVDYRIKKKAYEAAKDKEEAEDDLYDEYVLLYGKESTQALAQKIKKKAAEADVENAKKQMEQVAVSFDNAQYQVDKTSAAYKQALQVYENYKITAPVSGAIVAQINGTEGSAIVNANTSEKEPFIVLVDPESYWFETYVEDREALDIVADMKAYITLDAYPDKEFAGRVIFVSPVAELDANDLATYKVIIALDDVTEPLLSDLFGSADLVAHEVRDVLMISAAAVTNKQGKQFVIIKDGDVFAETEVQTGFTNGKKVEVTSGLIAGQEVVIIK